MVTSSSLAANGSPIGTEIHQEAGRPQDKDPEVTMASWDGVPLSVGC